MTPAQSQALAHLRSAEALAAQKRENAAYRVEVVDETTGDVVKAIPCTSQRQAERVEGGININLNHERYFTRIA